MGLLIRVQSTDGQRRHVKGEQDKGTSANVSVSTTSEEMRK